MKHCSTKFLRILSIMAGAIISCSLASANIVVKSVAVNPSDSTQKTAKIRIYLPEEIKPENIVNSGDMKIKYDEGKKQYYAYEEVLLDPSQSVEREVELADIWNIEAKVLQTKREDLEKVLEVLKKSEFEDKVEYIKGSVESKLKAIELSQSTEAANAQLHIQRYRTNMLLLQQAESDLTIARSLMLSAKKIPAVKIWLMIIVVIGLLSVLSAALYFIWNTQVKNDTDIFSTNSKNSKTEVNDLTGNRK